MKPNKIMQRTTVSVAAALLTLLFACKKEDNTLSNLPVERKNTANMVVIDAQQINTNTVWKDHQNGVDYLVKGLLIISNGNLTIAPGVTVMFEESAGLLVTEEGSLTAIGTSNDPIWFTSVVNKRGSWKGISILSSSSKNVLSHCKVELAGGENTFGKANIILGSTQNQARAEISYCEIRTSSSAGLLVQHESSQLINFVSNVFNINSGYPLSVPVNHSETISNSNKFIDNGKTSIEINSTGAVTIPIVIGETPLPVCFNQPVLVQNSVTLLPGVRIQFCPGGGIRFEENGQLIAVGQPQKPIVLQGTYQGAGQWTSLKFYSPGAQNRLEHVFISGGGRQSQAMFNFYAGHVLAQNCTFSNSASSGLFIVKSIVSYNADIETSNTFLNNASAAILWDE